MIERIETDRLILRPWRDDDLCDFYEYAKNPEVGPMAGWRPHASIEESAAILKRFMDEGNIFAIEHKTDGKVIGSLGIHGDEKRDGDIKVKMIGYVLSRDYWGQGLIPEAAKRAIRYLFETQDVDIVSIYHFSYNMQSKRVIEKCGFKYEGTIRMATVLFNGTTVDECCYSMTRDEYNALSEERN